MKLDRKDLIFLHLALPESIFALNWATQGNLESHLSEDTEQLETRLLGMQLRLSEALNKPEKEGK